MCFHSKQSKDAQTVANRFKVQVNPSIGFQSNHYNAFTYPKTPVITNNKRTELQLYQWGLIPSWAQDKTIQKFTLNAKIETLDIKPSFKNNIKNRCLIIADGFMEWQWLDSKGSKKQPYIISRPKDELFCFAGIYSTWIDKGSGEKINTYSIVTTVANPLMAEIHNSKKRMPIILHEHQEINWLAGANHFDFVICDIELIAKPIILN